MFLPHSWSSPEYGVPFWASMPQIQLFCGLCHVHGLLRVRRQGPSGGDVFLPYTSERKNNSFQETWKLNIQHRENVNPAGGQKIVSHRSHTLAVNMQLQDWNSFSGAMKRRRTMILPSSHRNKQWGRLRENLGGMRFSWDWYAVSRSRCSAATEIEDKYCGKSSEKSDEGKT